MTGKNPVNECGLYFSVFQMLQCIDTRSQKYECMELCLFVPVL